MHDIKIKLSKNSEDLKRIKKEIAYEFINFIIEEEKKKKEK